MKKFNYLSALFLICVLSSCFSPKPIIRLSPENEDTRFNHGRAMVTQTKGNYEVSIGYESFSKDHLIFNIEVINMSDETVLVDPANGYMTDRENIKVARAINPEAKLLKMEMDASRQEANAKNWGVAGAVLVTSLVVAHAVADDDNHCNDNDPDLFAFVDGNDSSPRQVDYTEQPSFWADETLRITHLEPNYRLNGQVLFPRIDNRRHLLLNFPIGDEVFSVTFKQKIIQP